MTGNVIWLNGETTKCNPRTGQTEPVALRNPRWHAFLMLLLGAYCLLCAGTPGSILEWLVFLALLLFFGCGVAVILAYEVGADEEEIFHKSFFAGRKTIKTDQVKAVYVEHYTEYSRERRQVPRANIMFLNHDGTFAFSISQSEAFLLPLVTFLQSKFPDQIEEGNDPSQYDSSRFARLLVEANGTPKVNVDRSLLTKAIFYGGACQFVIVEILACGAYFLVTDTDMHSWRVITLFLLVLFVALSATYLIICNFLNVNRQSRFQAPRFVRVPFVAGILNLFGYTLLLLFLLCTWSWWTPNWQWPFVVCVVFGATVCVLVAAKNVTVLRRLRDQVQEARRPAGGGYSEESRLMRNV